MLPEHYRLLVVEDNEPDAQQLERALRRAGGRPPFEIRRARSAAEAVAVLAERAFDAIVLDLSLPDASGAECFEGIRAVAGDAPIVIMTGHEDDALALSLLERGAQDYVLKSQLSPPDVERCIRYAIKRREAERALERGLRTAEEAARAKGSFIAAMSHEIRTPLNAILGMADLLLGTTLQRDQREYVQVFRRAGRGLLDLLENVLELSRLESGRFELRHDSFDAVSLVQDCVEMFGFAAHGKGLALVADMEPTLVPHRIGDPARVRQILVNLVGNAVKFTEAGCVEVSLRDVGAGSGLEIEVLDTGPGIPSDRLERIFERFAQADPGVFTRHGGSGLGLALCRELVERMGGSIGARNRPKGGAGFTVRVPLRVDPLVQTEPKPLARLAGLRVLLVDDSQPERRCYAAWLRREGAEVVEVASAAAAREALALTRFGVAVLDARMPEEGGLSIAETLAGCVDRPRVVVLLSMNHRSADYARCAAAAAHPLLKPLRCETLVETVRGASPKTVEPDATLPTKLGSLKLLLAEDSVDNRALVEAFLRDTDVELRCVETGADALRVLRGEEFDLILMDVSMPEMDGHEATRRIRARERERGAQAVPILALTAHASPADARASLAAGCDGHMTKPFDRRALLEAIRRYARRPSGAEGELAPPEIDIDPQIADLLPDYLKRRSQDVGALRIALAAGDRDTLRTLGHRMKGSGTGYGLPRVSELGAELERAARHDDLAGADRTIQALAALLAALG